MTTLLTGRHPVKAIKCALGIAGTGAEQIGVLVQIIEGPHAGEVCTWYGFFTDAAFERTIESLRHLGWQGDDLTKLETIGSQTASAVFEVEEDRDGTQRTRVAFINAALDVAMRQRMEPEAAARFAAAIARKLSSKAPASGKTPAGKAPAPGKAPASGKAAGSGKPAGSVDKDDDIPF